MRGQVHDLELVYPPISNQEAEWVKDDPAVQARIAHSNIYFIGQRPETFFQFPKDVEEKLESQRQLHFIYKSGKRRELGFIDIDQLFQLHNLLDDVTLELGPKMIRIWSIKDGQRDMLLDWQTTEKILFDKSHRKLHIKGLDHYKELSVFNLNYVGISKKDDSLQRLVIKPHDKRLRILSNEHPLNEGSRVTDEIVLFFFRIASLEIKQYMKVEDFEELAVHQIACSRDLLEQCAKRRYQ